MFPFDPLENMFPGGSKNKIRKNGETYSKNSSAKADKLFECVWPFCGVGA